MAVAVAAARVIETSMQIARAPLSALLAALDSLKLRYRWIRRFDAEPEGFGYLVYLIATKVPIGFYSTQTWDTSRNAAILRQEMERAGVRFREGQEAHHIVASTHPRAQDARDILTKFGIDINGAENGAALAWSRHHGRGLHSHAGIDTVTAALRAAKSRSDAIAILSDLAEQMRRLRFRP